MNVLVSREDDACVVLAFSPDTSLRGLTTTSSIGRYPIAEVCGRSLCSVKSQPEPGLLDDLRRGLSREDNILIISMPTHGEVVRIRHGPLAGVEGVFESYQSGKERVVVLLRALTYQSRAVVKLSDIERFSEVTG